MKKTLFGARNHYAQYTWCM